MSTQVDRLTKLTSQLVGDIGRLPGVTLDAAGEAQLVQLLTDAMEQVGHLALEVGPNGPELVGPYIVHDYGDCRLTEPHYHGKDGIYPTDIRT